MLVNRNCKTEKNNRIEIAIKREEQWKNTQNFDEFLQLWWQIREFEWMAGYAIDQCKAAGKQLMAVTQTGFALLYFNCKRSSLCCTLTV